MVTYMRPILGLGNVTVLADLWRTRNSLLFVLASPFFASHRVCWAPIPILIAFAGGAYINSNVLEHSEANRTHTMTDDSSVLTKKFKTALPIDLKSTTICQAFKALEHLSSDQACRFTVGLTYANILAPQLLLHDPPKTLPFVTEM